VRGHAFGTFAGLVTGADLHGAPDQVFAPQRLCCDTLASSVRRMGLSVNFVSSPLLGFDLTEFDRTRKIRRSRGVRCLSNALKEWQERAPDSAGIGSASSNCALSWTLLLNIIVQACCPDGVTS
jgi:hypothetical protein